MIETKQLRIFRTIVDVGSFTGAGEHLGISQPAISQHIRALEEELGQQLLVRVGKTTRATPAGQILLHGARQVLDKLDETERMLSEHGQGRAGMVRIGMPEPPCNYLLPAILADMKRRFPKIDARVTSGHTAVTLARLAGGELDMAVIPLPADTGTLRVVDAGLDELVAIVPPTHPWVAMPYVTARDFEAEPVVLYDRASQITELTLGFLLDEGVFPRIAVEIDHLEAVKELVRSGVGVAVVPAWSARRELAEGTLAAVRLGPSGLGRSWGIVHPDLRPQPATMRALLQLFVEALPPLFATTAPGAQAGDGGGGRDSVVGQ
jgi:DNA-binding transcriptional LysR family regulator